ncbi:MAG: thermonuclease family protein [Myxococcota bacterium]
MRRCPAATAPLLAWAVLLVPAAALGARPAPVPDEPPAVFEGRVVKVLDGDTIDVLWRKTPVRVRFLGIDTPEKAQAYGAKARDFVKRATRGGVVKVVGAANDGRKRRLAEIFSADGASLNRQLVAQGLAWHYAKYSDDATLAALEREARRKKLGLWADAEPVAPWDFRAAKRDGAKTETAPPPAGAVVGNRGSRIYHAPGCPDREKVSPRNRELFATESEAQAAGFRRARNCPR